MKTKLTWFDALFKSIFIYLLDAHVSQDVIKIKTDAEIKEVIRLDMYYLSDILLLL